MAYTRKKESVLESDQFDMTPLIDAVFLLLIFFMVTTVFKNPAQLKMVLPGATHPATLEKKQIVVEVDADANIAINGNEVSFESFEAYLAQEKYSSR